MRVLLLVHPQLDPRKATGLNQTERDVYASLKRTGHDVQVLQLQADPHKLVVAIQNFKPQIAFNLLEEFLSEACFDLHPVAILEAYGIPFTGCNPRGLALSRPKHIAKAIAKSVGFKIARSQVVGAAQISGFELKFPVIVKLNREDASRGLTQRNVVYSIRDLRACLAKLHKKYQSEMIIEEFISGQDLTLSLLGNGRPMALPAWRLHLPSPRHISSEVIKFSHKTRFNRGVRGGRAGLTKVLEKQMVALSKELFSQLELSGYARFDFRLSESGELYFLEANANPNLAKNEDFAFSARAKNLTYDLLVERIIHLGRSYRPRL